MHKVAIIGAGVVGTALGYLLGRRGYQIVRIASRTLRSAKKAKEFIGEGTASTDLSGTARKADVVFITTSDGAIQETCKKIASEDGFRKGSIVFHTCGALSSRILHPAKKKGAAGVASLHPLQSFASVQQAVKNLPHSYFSIEGDEPAVQVGREIIRALKGRELRLDSEKKVLYHAGAVAASNYLVATVGLALELFDKAGISRQDSLPALMPLIKGTIRNIEILGIPRALTGPISRGDIGVVRDHLRALEKEEPGLFRLYRELARYTVGVGIGKGTLKPSAAKKIISLLDR
ncbi:MAG: DUF2520 domain-containing protein [Nitrospirota bacterium]